MTPRLYETVSVNGQRDKVNMGDGKSTGQNVELYVVVPMPVQVQTIVRALLLQAISTNKGHCRRNHWFCLRAREATLGRDASFRPLSHLCRGSASRADGNNVKSSEECCARACLRAGIREHRFFDMKRYKRADLFSRTLHRLVIYRQVKDDATGEWKTSTNKWYNGDRTNKTLNKDNDAWYEPSHFEYKRLPITTGARAWWNGFDVKWYLFPFPQTEVLKGYLVQNPGW